MPTGISENLTLFLLQFFQANGKNFRIQNHGAGISTYSSYLLKISPAEV